MMFKTLSVFAALATAVMAQAPKGKAFDHIFIIWLENTDYSLANTTADLEAFLPDGIALTKYYGVTHPSEPNYIAASGGDYFGMADDGFYSIPASYNTIVDLLEAKGLTWRAYQENLPSPCFTGFEYNGTYFRKHNPFIIYDSIAKNATRCQNIVSDTQLTADLANNSLPNYAFFTPNMVNDGHNTTVAVAAAWLKGFLTPLLANPSFTKNTLVVVTFDESETYSKPNNVWAVLLGDAVPTTLKNTIDDTFYTHYSLLSTVEANWDLGSLGRNDAKPQLNNVFDFVAKVTNFTNANVTNPPLLNGTEPGFLAPNSTSTSSAPGAPGATAAPSPSASASPSGSGAAKNMISGAAVVVAGFAAIVAAML